VDYTLVAARAFANSIASQRASRGGKKFRFVYCSGTFTKKDQDKNLWIMSENRKMRGEVKLQLMQLSRECANDAFEVYCQTGVCPSERREAQGVDCGNTA
jgi:hypothetical protein